MPNLPVQVYIVEGDPSLCTAYARLVRSAKMQPQTFASVEDFMRSDFSDENASVITEIEMPGISGLELPALLARAGHHLPVIFVTEHDEPATRARAQRAGASGYFRKPPTTRRCSMQSLGRLPGHKRKNITVPGTGNVRRPTTDGLLRSAVLALPKSQTGASRTPGTTPSLNSIVPD